MTSVLQPAIHDLIEAKDFATLKAALREMEIHDVTALISELDDSDLAVAFRLLPRDQAAQVFGDLPHEKQEELFNTLSSDKAAAILNDLPPDERTYFLEELPGELAQKLLTRLRGDQLKIARDLLAYPEESIGRLMTPQYVAVRPDWTVQRVLEHIRSVAEKRETVNVIYVVDRRWRLLDDVPLQELVLARPDQLVRDLMDEQYGSLNAYEDQEEAIETFKKYDAVVLPVVNSQGIMVGIVTIDDVLDVVEEEHAEDFHMVTGMEAPGTSYFSTSFGGMMRKRTPWLILLLIGQTFTTIALLGFESLPLFAVLVLFMPLVNSPAGNAGSQMAGLMIRGLALQEIEMSDWAGVLLRELLRGLAFGVILAVLGFGAARILGAYSAGMQPGEILPIAMGVSIAIATAVTLANVVGAMLPFFFKMVGLDPAVTSGPFIASVMDVSGILIYFTVATAIVGSLG